MATMAEYENYLRKRLGLFANPEPPPSISQTDPTLFQSFAQQALPYLELIGAPMGMGLSAAKGIKLPQPRPQMPPGSPQSVAPNAPGYVRLIPADYNVARSRLPPDASLAERTAAAQEAARERLASHRAVQQAFEAQDAAAAARQRLVESSRQPTPPRIDSDEALRRLQDAFDINRFIPPERGRTKPGMSAAQREASKTYGESGQPGPGYGEFGNFLEAPVPGQMQRPPSLMDRILQLPNPQRRQSPSEMQLSPLRSDPDDISINYMPGGHNQGYVQGVVNPRRGTFNMTGSSLPSSVRGTGVGQTMYQRVIDEAHDRGLKVGSDNQLSRYSDRMYREVLPGLGYRTARSSRYRNQGGSYPHTTYDDSPVWRVYPKEPLEKNAPYWSLMDRLKMKAPNAGPYAIAPLGGIPLAARRFEDENY